MTHYERLINGTKEDLVAELVLVAEWARELYATDWYNITHSPGGLRQFVRDTLDTEYIDKIAKLSTHDKHACPYAYGIYQDLYYGTQYWCIVYGKECDNCKQGE